MASPSRSRVADRSFTSRTRFSQPSRDRITVTSSSTMKSSTSNSTSSPPAPPILLRRLSVYFLPISSISPRITRHSLRLSFRIPSISLARTRLSFSSSRMMLISSRASLYSFSSRMASVCSASRPKRLMIFSAASALPSDLRMIRMVSSRTSKMMAKPSRMWMRLFSASSSNWKRRRDHLLPEVQELAEDGLQIQAHRPGHLAVLGGHQAGHVDREAQLERGVLVDVGHHQVGIGAGLHLQHHPHLVGGLVAHVGQQGQLLAEDHLGDLLDQRRLGDVVGDRRQDDLLAALLQLLQLPLAAHAHAAVAGLVDLPQLLLAVDDLPAGGEVGTLDELHQVLHFQVPVVDQRHRRLAQLAQVVGRDVGGHADGDAGAAVGQQLRHLGRQHHGLFGRAVVVGAEVDGPLVDLLQQLHGQLGQAGLGVADRPPARRRPASRSCRARRPACSAARSPGPCAPGRRRRRCRRAGDTCPAPPRRWPRTCGTCVSGYRCRLWYIAYRIRRCTGFSPSRTSGSAREVMTLTA